VFGVELEVLLDRGRDLNRGRAFGGWTPAEPAGTSPVYGSLTLGGSEDPWTIGARNDDSTIRGGRVA
jgi:hypothetical protein